MTQLAYMLLALSKGSDGGYTQEAEVERNFFLEQYDQFQQMIDDMLKKSSRDLWKCNPNPYMENRTFASVGHDDERKLIIIFLFSILFA